MITALLFIISLIIVGWGQPHVSPILSLISSGIGFALFWVFLSRLKGKRNRFLVSTTWFFGVQLIQLSWLASPTYQGVYIYFVYLALSLWLGLQFGILSLFLPEKGSVSFKRILGISGLWVLMEWGRLFVLCGFAWNPVGLSMTGYPIQGQLASVFGVFGLSFIVMVANLLAANFILSPRKKAFMAFGGVFLFPYLFGSVHLAYHYTKERGPIYHAVLVQTALLPDEKQLYTGREEKFVHPYLQWYQLLSHLKKYEEKDLDLIVFPEYALPFSSHATIYPLTQIQQVIGHELGDLTLLLKEPLAEKRGEEWFVSNALLIQALANRMSAEIVIGLDAEENEKNFNAAFHFIPHHQEIFRYEKRVLLPLAEYLPFSFLKPLVARYGILNFFSHGKEAKVTQGKHPMSLSVCYEECFPHVMREGKRKGAKLFVNVTNDGWYPYSQLPEQHFTHGRVRAIENGVPLLRACNTGVTAGVDSLGRTIARFENGEGNFELEKGALYVPVDLYSYLTLYSVWGDAFILILSLISLVFLKPKRENPLAENRSLN